MILAVLENQPGPGAQHRGAERRRGALRRRASPNPWKSGIERARKAIAKGEARQKLDDFIAFTKKHAKRLDGRMPDILERILARKREELEAARAAVPLAEMQRRAARRAAAARFRRRAAREDRRRAARR